MSYEFFKGLKPIERAQALKRRKAKWGKIGAGAADELEALVLDLLAIIEAYDGGLNKEEATKLRRQLAAANARVARASGREQLSPSDVAHLAGE